MKLFERSGGHWLFWTGAVYLTVGITVALSEYKAYTTFLQLMWLLALSAPFTIPPLGRWLNMSVEWDRKMFDWLKSRTTKEYLDETKNNVYNLPTPKAVPYVEPPTEPEKPVTTFYRLGITNNSRVSFQMGYSEITMNSEGIDNMIKQLQVFRDQVREYEEQDNADAT